MSQQTKKYSGYTYVKSSGGILEYTLKKNGLQVLLLEDHSAPVIGVMVTYRVGSRNEAVGHTGATHILEHLMFKGSRKFNRAKGTDISETLEHMGAKNNATTWLDRTNYFAVAQSANLKTLIELEADRMRHAVISEEGRASEMTVVRNEFERGENNPFEALDKQIWAAAYTEHPYHHPTIGWRSDIENVPIERLQKFYNTFYWPNNATVVLVGDFKINEALSLVKKYFGVHSCSPKKIPEVYTVEPKQEGSRRTVVRRTGQSNVVGIAHKTPPGLHEDTHALQVLSIILGAGKNSVLYKALVDRGLAVTVGIYNFPFHDSALFITYALLAPGMSHERIEKVILQEYKKVGEKGITAKQLASAQARIKSMEAFNRDGAYTSMSMLNEAIATGDWTLYTHFNRDVQTVTADDVKRVAQTYFVEDQSTTGYFIGI